ncbi:MAG: DNA repair protein RecO [Cycloclasticus sp.]|nr:DNA repair protein RecO [Cycloclasticus sp.]
MNRVDQQLGFILKSQSFKENSLIHQVFTQNDGIISILSKGSKAKNSKHGSLLQAFRLLSLSWVGKNELKTLTGIEESLNIKQLQGSSLYCGFYVNELILNLLQKHDPHPVLFDAFKDIIIKLSSCTYLEAHLRQFEKVLFEQIGYGLQLDYDIESNSPIKPDQHYIYYAGQGPKPESSHHPDAVFGSMLINLNNNKLTDEIELKQAKRLMRRLIDSQLDGKILKSRDLFI